MKTKKALPNCKDCDFIARINGELVCIELHNERWDERGRHFKRINRRHSRAVARKCPYFECGRDSFFAVTSCDVEARKETK